MANFRNLFLIGPMGSGKSTLGKLLAKHLDKLYPDVRYVDLDHDIEQRTGVDIPTIFDIEGEAGFRQREHNALADLSVMQHLVLSTGGGTVIREDNRQLLRRCGYVIYLSVPLPQLKQRLANDTHRPLLQQDNPDTVIETLFHERDPLYRATADWVFDTDRLSVPKAYQAMLQHLTHQGILP